MLVYVLHFTLTLLSDYLRSELEAFIFLFRSVIFNTQIKKLIHDNREGSITDSIGTITLRYLLHVWDFAFSPDLVM